MAVVVGHLHTDSIGVRTAASHCMKLQKIERDLAAMRQSVASQAVAASALAAARYSRLACQVRRTVDEPALRKRICLHSDLTAGAGPLPTEGGMGSGTFMSEDSEMAAGAEPGGMEPTAVAPQVVPAAASAPATDTMTGGDADVEPAPRSRHQAYRAKKRELLRSPAFKEKQAKARRTRYANQKDGPCRPYVYKKKN